MNTKVFLGVVIVAAGILLGWYFLGNGKSMSGIVPKKDVNSVISVTPRVTKGATGENESGNMGQETLEKGGLSERSVVTYTDTGFAPSPLTVKKGTTVVFVNESSAQMLVASASYPTHQVLPSFVQKKAVLKSGMYEYTFEAEGTWKYQNDMSPKDSGSVIVVR